MHRAARRRACACACACAHLVSPPLRWPRLPLLPQLVFPLTAWAIKSAMEECAGEEGKEVVRKVPNGVLVFAVEGLYKAGKLAFQERGAA